jgi:hypothetical protein
MRRRKWSVGDLLAGLRSLSPSEQDEFVRGIPGVIGPDRAFMLGVDLLGEPGGAFRNSLKELVHAGEAQHQALGAAVAQLEAARARASRADPEALERTRALDMQGFTDEQIAEKEGITVDAVRARRKCGKWKKPPRRPRR